MQQRVKDEFLHLLIFITLPNYSTRIFSKKYHAYLCCIEEYNIEMNENYTIDS